MPYTPKHIRRYYCRTCFNSSFNDQAQGVKPTSCPFCQAENDLEMTEETYRTFP